MSDDPFVRLAEALIVAQESCVGNEHQIRHAEYEALRRAVWDAYHDLEGSA